mgnify:CR=1 FL=1|tara:strand:- start:745 stop:1323 length:579 start_codon:yes stop_codon:yes gene_type:complete
MSEDIQPTPSEASFNESLLHQNVIGSNRLSNVLVAIAVSIGGTGFLLASTSSYTGHNLLPLGNPATLVFIPQGLIMGLYGLAGFSLAIYLWTLIYLDFGSGFNKFDKDTNLLEISRKGFFKEVKIEISLKDIKAVKLEVRDGFNARRRITLRIKNRNDIPLSGIGQPRPLVELERESAELARFLGVNLEGIS